MPKYTVSLFRKRWESTVVRISAASDEEAIAKGRRLQDGADEADHHYWDPTDQLADGDVEFEVEGPGGTHLFSSETEKEQAAKGRAEGIGAGLIDAAEQWRRGDAG